MQNNYQLAGHLQTTGWNTTNDVNATNTFGMTPAEVALQAGDLKEFIQSRLIRNSKLQNWGVLIFFWIFVARNLKSTTKSSSNTSMKTSSTTIRSALL